MSAGEERLGDSWIAATVAATPEHHLSQVVNPSADG